MNVNKEKIMNYRIAISVSSFAAHDDTPKKLLENAGVEIVPNPYGRRLTETEIIQQLKGIHGVIAGLEPLNKKVLESADNLKAIARVGIGMTNVDIEAAKDLGIKVSNTPDGPTEAVAELCLTALLAIGRNLVITNQELHAGNWKKRLGFGLRGTKILLVGYGRIGRRFAEILRYLGAEILVTDPVIEADSLTQGEKLVSLSQGLAEAKVVSLHASGIECLLGEPEFQIMQKGIVLLNSARGELIDENALVKALNKGTVSAAWFDAFIQEPYSGELLQFDQVLLTPHVSTYSVQCRRFMEEAAVQNLLQDLGIK